MQIALSSPTTLRITWPLYPAQTEAELQRRLATVPGLQRGRGRMAYAPIIQLQRLMTLYPLASYQYEAIAAADDLAKSCYQQLAKSGITLRLNDAGDVEVTGDTSTEIQQYVTDRSHALRPFVKEQMEQGTLVEVAAGVADVVYPRRKTGSRKRKVGRVITDGANE